MTNSDLHLETVTLHLPLLGFSPCYTDGSSLVVMPPSVGHMDLDVENLEVGLAFP